LPKRRAASRSTSRERVTRCRPISTNPVTWRILFPARYRVSASRRCVMIRPSCKSALWRGANGRIFPRRRSRAGGSCFLFSLQAGEPLALIHDFSLSAIRVGATTGVANRALAKRDSKIVGIFGSGNEARTNLEAICAVRSIEQVKVYSVTKEHRDRFAEEMTELLNVEVQPVSNPEAVVRG